MTAILFIIMRTDLKSMNSGKAIAQGSHAANAAAKHAERYNLDLYTKWSSETEQDFGTVLTLGGGTIENIEALVEKINAENFIKKEAVVAGILHDPSYPIRDGSATHHIPLNTCAYVLCYKDSTAHKTIRHLDLHP